MSAAVQKGAEDASQLAQMKYKYVKDVSQSKDIHPISKNAELTKSLRHQKKVGMSLEGKRREKQKINSQTS